MKIIIMSHKRPDDVKTTAVFKNAMILVPESQKDDYLKYNKENEIITHPDTVIGLSPKRQWACKKFGDTFQLDDDITSIRRIYISKESKHSIILTPEESEGLIFDLHDIAKQTKAKLFGLNRTTNPKAYNGNHPIIMNKYICGGGLGLIKSDHLYFPEDYPNFVGEDYFINALNAYFHRYSYIDSRFAFQFVETESSSGGCSDYRTEKERKKTYLYLKQKFGDAIKSKNTNTIKKIINRYEKTLKIPY